MAKCATKSQDNVKSWHANYDHWIIKTTDMQYIGTFLPVI